MFSVSKLNILKVFSERNCLLCGATSKNDLCNPCRNQFPKIPINHCPICLLPVTTPDICSVCLTSLSTYTRIIAACRYAFPVDALIHSLKYQSNLVIAPILANLLMDKINLSDLPDFILPMPLHPKRLRERGFNQAVEIGRYISQKYKIRMLLESCIRVKNTPFQAGLPWRERKKNIRDAFICTVDLTDKHVVILDDVMTSGATMIELAKVLHHQGAAKINGWVIARTLPAAGQNFSLLKAR